MATIRTILPQKKDDDLPILRVAISSVRSSVITDFVRELIDP